MDKQSLNLKCDVTESCDLNINLKNSGFHDFDNKGLKKEKKPPNSNQIVLKQMGELS